jgi:hypothetical protein
MQRILLPLLKIALVVSINTAIAGEGNIEPNRFAEVDFSSAYNDNGGFYNASNHPNFIIKISSLNFRRYNHSVCLISHRVNHFILINTSRRRHSVAQLITEKAKFLNRRYRYARYLGFGSYSVHAGFGNVVRSEGKSIRCIKN